MKSTKQPSWQRLMLRAAVVLSLGGVLTVPLQIKAQSPSDGGNIEIEAVDLEVPEGSVDGSIIITLDFSRPLHVYTYRPEGPNDYVLYKNGSFSANGEYMLLRDATTKMPIFCLDAKRDPVGWGTSISSRSYTEGSTVNLNGGNGSPANIKKAAFVMDYFYRGSQTPEQYFLAQLYIWEILGYGAPVSAVSGIQGKYNNYKQQVRVPSNANNIRISPGAVLYNQAHSSQTLAVIRATEVTSGGGGSGTGSGSGSGIQPGLPSDPLTTRTRDITEAYKTTNIVDYTLPPGTWVETQAGVSGLVRVREYFRGGVLQPSMTEYTTIRTVKNRIIRYNPIEETQQTKTEVIPYGTEEVFNSNIAPGTRNRVRSGVTGIRTRVETYRNGVFYLATPWTILRSPVTERWEYNDNKYVTRTSYRNVAFESEYRVNYNLEPGQRRVTQQGQAGREYKNDIWLARADNTLIRLVTPGTWQTQISAQNQIIEYNPTPVIIEIPFETVTELSSDRWNDETPITIQPGVPGEIERVLRPDGSYSEAVRRNPIPEIISVGTKPAHGKQEYTSEEIIHYDTEIRESPDHDIYYRETVQQGVNGRKLTIYSRDTYRGEWARNSRPVVVSSEVLLEPVTEIIVQGTKTFSFD